MSTLLHLVRVSTLLELVQDVSTCWLCACEKQVSYMFKLVQVSTLLRAHADERKAC